MSVSSQTPEWQILTCPSCAGLFKVPRSQMAAGNQVKCPRCHAVTPVPGAAGETDKEAFKAAVPEREPEVSPEKRSGGAAPATAAGDTPGDGGAGPSIPKIRSFDPEAPLVRGRGRESWEQKAPELRKVDFKDKLAKTTDAAAQVTGNEPKRVRRDWRREKAVAELTGWETGGGTGPAAGKTSRAIRWSMLTLTALGVVTLLAVGIRMILTANNTAAADTGGGVAGPQELLEIVPAADYRDQVWEAARRFTGASTPEEMLPWIRERERVEPLLRAWYARNPEALAPFEAKRPPELAELQALQDFVVFMLEMPDFSRRAIALERTPEGFRVDWESYTAYSEMSWAELQRERPGKPVLVRAIMQPVEFLPMEGVTARTHRCFRLTTPNGEETLYGYVPLEGKLHENIVKSILRSPSLHAVLRVRYPENSPSEKQVFITDYLIRGWILRKNGEAAEDPATGVLGGG